MSRGLCLGHAPSNRRSVEGDRRTRVARASRNPGLHGGRPLVVTSSDDVNEMVWSSTGAEQAVLDQCPEASGPSHGQRDFTFDAVGRF